jgi:hypothetical protein
VLGVSVTPRPLFNPGKNPVPIVQETRWAPGPVWTGAENLAPTGIQSPDRSTRSQSLYRLRYAAHAHFSAHRKILGTVITLVWNLVLQQGKNWGNGVFANRVLRKMFRPWGGGITVRVRKLHQELHNFYSLRKQTTWKTQTFVKTLQFVLKKLATTRWTGLICLKIGYKTVRCFKHHKMQEISWLVKELSAFQKWLYHVESVFQKRPFPSAPLPIRHPVTKLVFGVIQPEFLTEPLNK